MSLRNLVFLAVVVVAFALGFILRGKPQAGHQAHQGDSTATEAAAETRWTCSMHPQIILPSNDQQCPICFMDLIPLEENSTEGLDPSELALSPQAEALADIQTARVFRGPALRSLSLVGKVQVDQSRTRTITARVGGRLDKLFVDTTGGLVSAGMSLADIYSPDLYQAQAELKAAANLPPGDPTRASVIKRLQLWGMGQSQIQSILDGGPIREHLRVTAPVGGVVLGMNVQAGDYVQPGQVIYRIADLNRVWVSLEAFESDLAWLKEGQTVALKARARPGREFTGEIHLINPVLSDRSRTVEVRLEVTNEDGLLKPGMLVRGEVEVQLDRDGQAELANGAGSTGDHWPLLIPSTAPLLMGDQAVVYVRRNHEGQGVFQGRRVNLGPRANDHYIVLSGLKEGDEVVSQGTFKIDSALQIQAQPSMMSQDPVVPEFVDGLSRLLEEYFVLQNSLADDDDPASQTAAVAVQLSLEKLDENADHLPTQGRVLWTRHHQKMQAAVEHMISSSDLASRRVHFEPLSDELWAVVGHFAGSSEVQARRFHCPMAMDGKGAYWLQDSEVVANPYYGESMLRCGSQVEVIQ